MIKKKSALVQYSVSLINITSRYISSTITTSLGGRSIGQCSVELYMRNMVILHCGGPDGGRTSSFFLRRSVGRAERPSLALKLPLVLYAAAAYASVYCACSDSTAEKKTKCERGREGGREADCDHREDNCGLGRGERGGHGQAVRARGQVVALKSQPLLKAERILIMNSTSLQSVSLNIRLCCCLGFFSY